MVKTIRKKIAIILIMSMLMQLFVGVTPVLAEDASDLEAEEPEYVPLLSAVLSPGEITGATSVTVTDHVYGSLVVNITEAEVATPYVGDAAPIAGDNLIADYESGADITAGVATGNYLQIYDVDMEDEARIVGFYQAELTEDVIKEADMVAELAGEVGGMDFYSEEAAYTITNDEAEFLVNGVDEYGSFQSALNACAGDGSQIIRFGSPGNALEIDEVSYYTGNALISAIYQGSIVIKEKTSETSYGLTIPDGVEVKFSGLTVSAAPDMTCDDYFNMVYVSGGSLTIEEGTVINADSPFATGVALESGGGLIMNGGEISATYSNANCIANWGYGTVLINGGTITTGSSCEYECISNNSSGSLVISGGSITNNSTGIYAYAIYSQGNGAISISGGARIQSVNHYGIYIYNNAAINISGGEVIGNQYAIFNNDGQIIISGGSVRATGEFGTAIAIYGYNNTAEISGGTVEGPFGIMSYGRINVSGEALIKGTEGYGIDCRGDSRDISNPAVVISSGTVEGKSGAIYNTFDGLIRINGGNITGGESASYAIYNYDAGTIDITGGTISGGDTVIYNFSTGNIEISNTAEIRSDEENMIILRKTDISDTSNISLFGKVIYGHNMADILLKGEHTGGDYSVNSLNYTDASLSAEDYEPSTYTLAYWTSDAARAVEIGSGDGSTIGDLTSGGNSAIYAHVALSSSYFDVPGGGAFTDTDESANRIAGELSWTIPTDISGITGYKVYWGTVKRKKLSAEALYTITDVNNCSQTVSAGTALPNGAKYFLVYSYGATGESYYCLSISIVDVIVNAQTPVIHTQPTGTTVNVGETAIFTVSATAPDGGSLTYQWQRSIDSGFSWSNLGEASTNPSYTMPVLDYADNGAQYRCVVINSKNGTTATVHSNAAILTVNPATISAASITGIVAPATGASPVTAGSLIAGNGSYTVTGLTWENSDGTPATLTEDGKFKAGSTYRAVIELTAAAGYKFQVLIPVVNAGTAEAGTISADEEENSLTFVVTFTITDYMLTYTAGANGSITGAAVQTVSPGSDGTAVTAVPDTGYHFVKWSDGIITATRTDVNVSENIIVTAEFAKTEATSITVKTQPTKLAYRAGEILDLTGLIVTLDYNDGSTVDIELADFDANGTVMSVAAHDGKPVMLTWNSLTAATNNLTVNAITPDKHSASSTSSAPPPTSSVPPTNTGVDILINGKAETAATATITWEGDKLVTSVLVDDKKVEERLVHEGNNVVVTIPVKNSSDTVIATLNGQTVKNMENMEAVLEIKTKNVTYTIPASQINIDAVSAQFGEQIELKDIAVSVKISEPAADILRIVENTANNNYYQIVVSPVEFEITCSGGGKTVEVSKFTAFVERLIEIPENIDPLRITTGVILNSDGTFSHVPTVITIIDGKYYAKITV